MFYISQEDFENYKFGPKFEQELNGKDSTTEQNIFNLFVKLNTIDENLFEEEFLNKFDEETFIRITKQEEDSRKTKKERRRQRRNEIEFQELSERQHLGRATAPRTKTEYSPPVVEWEAYH